MDKDLADASRRQCAQNLFDLVRETYLKVNKDYLRKQIAIASEYLTEEQKEELKELGLIEVSEE